MLSRDWSDFYTDLFDNKSLNPEDWLKGKSLEKLMESIGIVEEFRRLVTTCKVDDTAGLARKQVISMQDPTCIYEIWRSYAGNDERARKLAVQRELDAILKWEGESEFANKSWLHAGYVRLVKAGDTSVTNDWLHYLFEFLKSNDQSVIDRPSKYAWYVPYPIGLKHSLNCHNIQMAMHEARKMLYGHPAMSHTWSANLTLADIIQIAAETTGVSTEQAEYWVRATNELEKDCSAAASETVAYAIKTICYGLDFIHQKGMEK